MVSAGWALELRGHKIDLDDLQESLRPPFDPWVEEYSEGGERRLLLRSHAWKDLSSTGEMMAEATRLIDHINGALIIAHPDAKPIMRGLTLRFREDGTRIPVIVSASLQITLEGARVRGRAIVGQSELMKEPTPSRMQLQLRSADQNPILSDLLTFINRADNWFDLFKAMELVERLIGGEAAAQKISTDWKRVRRTANRHRHAPGPKHTLPPNPPTIPEARSLLIAVTRRVVDEHEASSNK